MNYVIAIAGPVGSGKSSLTNGLAERLLNATSIHFDHYEDITRKQPQELVSWIENGADLNTFTIPGLARDLEMLKRGEPVTDPVTGEVIESRKYIVFEMPLGKAHAATSPFIDLLLWIDLPLDVALARKLRQHTGMFLKQGDKSKNGLIWLNGYLDSYLLFVHDILTVQHNKVRPGADLLLDGSDDLDSMCQKASLFINTNLA